MPFLPPNQQRQSTEGDKQKYDQLLHDELHWLEVPQQVQYKLCRTVH